MTLKKSPSYRQKKELTEFRRYFFAKAIKSGIAFPDRHQETVKNLMPPEEAIGLVMKEGS